MTRPARVTFVRGQARERELIDFLSRHQPASTQALGDVLSVRLNPTRLRAWLIGDGTTTVGAVVETRICYDRWEAFAALDDPAFAPLVARVVDRGPAILFTGLVHQLEPVLPLLSRLRFAHQALLAVGPHPVHRYSGEPDPRTRLATASDFRQLADLYCTYGIGVESTRWQIASSVRRNLRHRLVIVLVIDDRIVAATAVKAMTPHYMIVDDLVVHPDFRGQGLSHAIGSRAQALSNALGLSTAGVVFSTNPMTIDDQYASRDRWLYAVLRDQRRFPGHVRVRRLLHDVQPLERADLSNFRPVDTLPYGDEFEG